MCLQSIIPIWQSLFFLLRYLQNITPILPSPICLTNIIPNLPTVPSGQNSKYCICLQSITPHSNTHTMRWSRLCRALLHSHNALCPGRHRSDLTIPHDFSRASLIPNHCRASLLLFLQNVTHTIPTPNSDLVPWALLSRGFCVSLLLAPYAFGTR